MAPLWSPWNSRHICVHWLSPGRKLQLPTGHLLGDRAAVSGLPSLSLPTPCHCSWYHLPKDNLHQTRPRICFCRAPVNDQTGRLCQGSCTASSQQPTGCLQSQILSLLIPKPSCLTQHKAKPCPQLLHPQLHPPRWLCGTIQAPTSHTHVGMMSRSLIL